MLDLVRSQAARAPLKADKKAETKSVVFTEDMVCEGMADLLSKRE